MRLIIFIMQMQAKKTALSWLKSRAQNIDKRYFVLFGNMEREFFISLFLQYQI